MIHESRTKGFFARESLANLIFWLHFVVGAIWYGLFLVPISWWSGKISFHFFLTLFIVGHQFLWGAILIPWTKRYRTVCVLTTILQLLRGKDITDPENYNHSFTIEMARKTHITIPHFVAIFLNFLVFTLVTIQYFLHK